MGPHPTLFDTLQRQFCPPLDTSLLAALIAELELDADGESVSPTTEQIEDLQTTLQALAAQADESESQLCDNLNDIQFTATMTDDTGSLPEFYRGDSATASSSNTSSSSTSSASSQHSFSSPLGFLQAALPHIPTERLSLAIGNTGDDGEIDMEDVISGILTEEYLRELEERGLDGLDEDDALLAQTLKTAESWETVEPRKKSPPKGPKRKTPRGKTMTLVDVRQQQHARPRTGSADSQRSAPASDPWTQLSSISTYVASLLPPHPPSFFLSFFHSPEHVSPYYALCAALASLSSQSTAIDEIPGILPGLLDVLLASYEPSNSEERARLVSDAQLSLAATNGRGDDALDLVHVLRDLDSDSTSGYLEMGVYHQPPRSRSETKPPAGPPPVHMPLTQKQKQKPKPPPTTSTPKRSPYQWQAVPQRRVPGGSVHPLAESIPAYNSLRVANGKRSSTSAAGYKGEMDEYRRRMALSIRKRNELLREASKMWKRGNSKTRGGEVAYYFAERAREFQELAKKEALDAARTMVESKRMASRDLETVDLHGTTVAEAVVIAREILQRSGATPTRPLKIITGRGTHSAGKIGVLKPAVRAALVEDGWLVGTWDGGLIVRGKRGRPV